MMYNVDLRSRETGNSEVKGILVTDSHDKAWKFAREWNERNLPDYNVERAYESYKDGTKGLFADVYEIPDENERSRQNSNPIIRLFKDEFSEKVWQDYCNILRIDKETAKKIISVELEVSRVLPQIY